MINRLKCLIDNPWGIGILSVSFIGMAVSYVLLGRFDQPESMTLLLCMSVFLFLFTFVYIRYMEDISPKKWVFFGVTVWIMGWLVEEVSQQTGLLGGYYHYDYAHPHAFSLGRVPLLVPTIWLLFSLLVGSITHYLTERRNFKLRIQSGSFPRWELLRNCLISGVLMLSIDFAIEWHFSSIAEFWKWRIEAGPVLAGIPIGNYLLWFGIGFLVPILERATGVPERKYLRNDRFLRALPTLGLCILLGAGGAMNIFYEYMMGALLCGFSLFLLLGFVLTGELSNMKSMVFRQNAGSEEFDGFKRNFTHSLRN